MCFSFKADNFPGYIAVEAPCEIFNRILRDHYREITENERNELIRLTTGIYPLLRGRSNVRFDITMRSLAAPQLYKIGNGTDIMSLNVTYPSYYLVPYFFEVIIAVMWQNKRFMIQIFVATIGLIVLMFTDYTIDDMIRLINAFSGIDTKLQGIKNAFNLSNNTQ